MKLMHEKGYTTHGRNPLLILFFPEVDDVGLQQLHFIIESPGEIDEEGRSIFFAQQMGPLVLGFQVFHLFVSLKIVGLFIGLSLVL